MDGQIQQTAPGSTFPSQRVGMWQQRLLFILLVVTSGDLETVLSARTFRVPKFTRASHPRPRHRLESHGMHVGSA